MKSTLWPSARSILTQNKVSVEGYGSDRDFYLVAGNELTVERQKEGTFIRCCCVHHSIYGNESLCSFKAALVSYLVLKDVVKKREGTDDTKTNKRGKEELVEV